MAYQPPAGSYGAPGVEGWGAGPALGGQPGWGQPADASRFGGGAHRPFDPAPQTYGAPQAGLGYQTGHQAGYQASYGSGAFAPPQSGYQAGYGGGAAAPQQQGYQTGHGEPDPGATGSSGGGCGARAPPGAGAPASWLAAPPAEEGPAEQAEAQPDSPSRPRSASDLFAGTLRRRSKLSSADAGGEAARRESRDRTPPRRRPAAVRVVEESAHLLPLCLARAGRPLACRLHSLATGLLSLLAEEPSAWLAPMFAAAPGKGGEEGEAAGERWDAAADDGLFRAATSLHRLEPWNLERLRLQLGRSLQAHSAGGGRPAAEAASWEAAELEADRDCEPLGCGPCAPRLVHGDLGSLQDAALPLGLSLRTRSHTRMKRRMLMATQLYELRLDVVRATLLHAPAGSAGGAFDCEEGRAAALLQELYSRYQREAEVDLTLQLDARLDALVAHGGELEAQATREQQEREAQAEAAQGHLPEPRAAGHGEEGGAREAYLRHLEDRRKLRARRDDGQRRLERLCRQLYDQWRKLVDIRQRQGFTSTPWRLRAQEEPHSQLQDAERRRRNVEAEVREHLWLRGAPGQDPSRIREVQENIENNWDKLRPPGMPSYRFELTATEEVTPTEGLRALYREKRDAALSREIARRRLVGRARVCVVCRVADRVVGRSPLFSLHWDTWSTASHAALEGGPAGQEAPLHSFDLAVRYMPKSVFLTVHVATHGRCGPCFRRWRKASEAEVELPGQDGRRVTHAAVLEQRLQFGPAAEAGEDGGGLPRQDGGARGSFGGELLVQASWPGDCNSSDLVVPPRQTYEEGHFVRNAAMGVCMPCRQSSPALAAQHKSPREKLDERLAGLRYDPQDPENARVLLESAAPRALPGYDVTRLGMEYSRLKAPGKSRRLKQLRDRAEHATHSTEQVLVPAFEREVKLDNQDEDQYLFRSAADGSTSQVQVQHRDDFVKRVQARLRKTAIVKTHVSYKSIVREHGQETQESNLMEKLAVLATLFQPKQTLRPAGERKVLQAAARAARVHVSLSKLHNAPVRVTGRGRGPAGGGAYGPQVPAGSYGSQPPAGSYGLPATYGGAAGMPPPGGSYGGFPPHGSGFGGRPGSFSAGGAGAGRGLYGEAPASVFGAPRHGLPAEALPQIVVELSLEDLDGNLLRDRTRTAAGATSPDINQILDVLLSAGSKGELTQESLLAFGGTLSLSVFDEVVTVLPERGGEMRQRRQRRYLGSFSLPWSTLYAAKSSVKGHFRVDQPPIIFGYRPKQSLDEGASPGAASPGSPPASRGAAAEEALRSSETTGLLSASADETASATDMYLALDVTVDPALVPPERVESQSFYPGAEPRLLLKHVQKWVDALQKRKYHVRALGTDIEGRSRLICRYVRPQAPPPHINPSDPFAIEAAARYVSLIPFLCDNEMFPNVQDLWCTDQEFLNIQCGDWEEHAILLCNYFNYIDRYRRDKVDGWLNTEIQSYCALCTVVPQGEITVVVRRDMQSGHCELWQASSGECFFVPHRRKPARRLCPARRGDAEAARRAQLPGTPFVPVRHIDVLFNQENVWANLQTMDKESQSSVRGIDFDLDNASCWRPLFPGGYAELRRFSDEPRRGSDTSPTPTSAAADAVGDNRRVHLDYTLEDPSQALVYTPADEQLKLRLERKFESDLEAQIRDVRASGEYLGYQTITNFNHVLAMRLGELLEDLEQYCGCRRSSGSEAVFPLRSSGALPVSLRSVEAHMQRIEQEFQRLDGGSRTVYGLPFNKPYTDFRRIWQAVRDSRVLELGGEDAVYALKVRVFPYACGVLSVWVFIACATVD